MHPEIVRDAPGSCPICGMALEPRTVGADEGPDPELVDMTRRFWIGARAHAAAARLRHGRHAARPAARVICIPGRVLGMAPARAGDAGRPVGGLAVLRARLGVGRQPQPQHVHADRARHRRWRTSTASSATLAPGLFPASFRTHGGEVGLYFEAAAVITVLVLLGQVLELRARSQTSSAIRALLGLAPPTARRLRPDGAEEDVPLEHVQVGDRLRVRPGEKSPGRRRRARRRERGGRIDGDRRVDARREDSRAAA